MKEAIIGYFISAGDVDVGNLITPYINGFENYFEPILTSKNYGTDLELLLVQYYVEGKFDICAPEKSRILNYSNKNKDIAVAFSVTRNKFHDVSDHKRRLFIVNTTLQAIDMVEKRLGKRKLDIHFASLRKDVRAAAEDYLS